MDEVNSTELSREIMHHIASLDRRRRIFLNNGLASYGLSGPMPVFLLTLEHFPGVSQDFLASKLKIDKSGIARIASQLEALGYIRREPSSDNRRMYKLNISEKGKAVIPHILRLLTLWRETIMDGMGAEKSTELENMLSKMVSNSEKL